MQTEQQDAQAEERSKVGTSITFHPDAHDSFMETVHRLIDEHRGFTPYVIVTHPDGTKTGGLLTMVQHRAGVTLSRFDADDIEWPYPRIAAVTLSWDEVQSVHIP